MHWVGRPRPPNCESAGATACEPGLASDLTVLEYQDGTQVLGPCYMLQRPKYNYEDHWRCCDKQASPPEGVSSIPSNTVISSRLLGEVAVVGIDEAVAAASSP